MPVLTYKTEANRTNKRFLSKLRSAVNEIPLRDSCVLLPHKKVPGVANEVDEFIAANWATKSFPKLLLIEQDKKLAQNLKDHYGPERIPVFCTKLSRFMGEFRGKISYLHADYCATVNQEANDVIFNMRDNLSTQGAVLRFTHSRRNNYRYFHLKDTKNLIDWLVDRHKISRKAGDDLYQTSLDFQTDPTLRVGIQLIANHVMGINTLRDSAQICLEQRNMNYNIVDCVVDKYQDTGACMQTMRFVLAPCPRIDSSAVILSLYTVINALQ